ncbi:hypothetical protein [Xenorhabdus nematophila]|uniref:hypothetical protein n=1 Tax=Xenorhabdus nematophila TaxID=628 RepID=UPI001F47F63B|nr:hypothetical protein [Xenorhabdus nematophila]
MKELELPLYDDHELREDKYYIAKKLGVSTEQLDEYIFSSGHNYDEYPNWDSKYAFMKKIQNLISKTTGHHVKKYS